MSGLEPGYLTVAMVEDARHRLVEGMPRSEFLESDVPRLLELLAADGLETLSLSG